MAAPNLATAYITILPSMRGAREKIAADLGDAGEKGGVAGGKKAEKGFVGGLQGISSKAAGIAAAASAVVGAGVVAGMPKAAQWFAEVLPLTHFLRLIRGIMLRGASLAELWPSATALAGFSAAMMAVSILRFRKRLD